MLYESVDVQNAHGAIEELKAIKALGPKLAWVHAQLYRWKIWAGARSGHLSSIFRYIQLRYTRAWYAQSLALTPKL